MSDTDLDILKMISPEYNVSPDEAVRAKILAARSAMIGLEKMKTDNNPVPAGSKSVLRDLLGLEKDVCSFPAFLFYCEEVAHAYLLNDEPKRALEYAASSLTCAQVLENQAAQLKAFELLFKIAVFANDFRMAMGFLEEKRALSPLEPDLAEAYESIEAVVENGLEPEPRFRIEGGELPIAEAVMDLLQRGPAEMAARYIRRAGGMTLDDARLEAEKLTETQLNTMFGV